MTNTINVPRELLAELQEHIHCHHDAVLWGKVCDLLSTPSPANHVEDVRAMVADPSPAGVDGLEVIGYVSQDDIKWRGDCTLRLKPYSDYVIPLCRLSSAQAIIDGLRGELRSLEEYAAGRMNKNHDLRQQLNRQDQRIGELEGLLRATGEAGRQLSNAAYNLAQREGHELTKCECALLSSLRKQWDAARHAALSAVCAAAPNIAPTSEHSGS